MTEQQTISKTREYSEETAIIKNIFSNEKKKHIAIICHDQPDPDCISSALCVQAISNYFDMPSTIFYGGEIGHTQNRVLINKLNIHMNLLNSEEEEEESTKHIIQTLKESIIIVVDTSSFGKSPCESIAGYLSEDIKPDLFIDHHDFNSKISCDYIHKSTGACVTIVYKIIKELGIEVNKTLATAIYFGISTDTANLKSESTSEDDKKAFDEIKTLVDTEAYEKILNYPRSSCLLDMRRKTYNSLVISNNLAIADVGVISKNQRSLIGEICEELLQVESIETAVVMGIVDEGLQSDKHLVASFRTQLLAMNIQDFITKTFGKKYGGGRKGAGAIKITLDPPLKSSIDFIKNLDGDNGKLNNFLRPIFDSYASKLKNENSNL